MSIPQSIPPLRPLPLYSPPVLTPCTSLGGRYTIYTPEWCRRRSRCSHAAPLSDALAFALHSLGVPRYSQVQHSSMLAPRHVPRWNSYTPHAPRCTLLGRFHFALPAVDPLNCVRFVPRSSFRSVRLTSLTRSTGSHP